MDFLNPNLGIIAKRWPDIAQKLIAVDYDIKQVALIKNNELSLVFDDIQVASSYDQKQEAIFQMASIDPNSPAITVYGTGLGNIQNQLIKQDSLKNINVVILNLALFKVSIRYFEQANWLEDQRVNLLLPQQAKNIIKPFIALPADLVLADNESAQLRDKVCLSLDSDFINKNNGADNISIINKINENLDFIINDQNVEELFLSKRNGYFIVCGAGPTLEDHFDWLKTLPSNNDYTLVAVDAAVLPLAQIGIIPDIIVSIDPIAKNLFQDLEKYKNTPLVYFPVLDADFLDTWPGPRYVAYSVGELYQKIFNTVQRGRLYSGGSVIHPAIDLSVKMGANKVLLLGADFSFPDGRTHTYWEEDQSSNAVHVALDKVSHWVLNSFNQRVPTLLNYRGYLRDLEQYIAINKQVLFYNGSKKGAFIEGTTIWTGCNEI